MYLKKHSLVFIVILLCFLSKGYAQNFSMTMTDLSELTDSQDGMPLMGHLISAQFDNENNLYVLDNGNKQIHAFNKNGEYLKSFGGEGRGPGEFLSPSRTLAIDREQNRVFVADFRNGRIVGYNTQNGENDLMVRLQSTSMIPINRLIFFEGDLYLLGSHQQSDLLIHRIDTETGETTVSKGDFIDFDSFVHNSNGKMQLSIVHASDYRGQLLVGLAAPNRMQLFDHQMEIKKEFEDDLLPTPWKTHMIMEPDRYQSTFYSMSINNQIMSEDLFIYKWYEVLDPRGPEIVYHLELRSLNSGEMLFQFNLDQDFIIAMHRVSDRSALLFMRDDNYNYFIRQLDIHEN